ncbi:MAG: MAPEG family protein [Woeseiaceae bacterium]|nr:MAPEG family protein [Woeseiaceae bacterium]
MTQLELIYPMAALVLLTIFVLYRMVRGRVAAVRRGDVDARYYKTYQGDNTEPRQAVQNARHFTNLFENPVLFYAACIVAMASGLGGMPMLVLAWLFVASRVAHAAIHLTSNRIPQRMAAYGVSWFVLAAMWLWLVYGAATAP